MTRTFQVQHRAEGEPTPAINSFMVDSSSANPLVAQLENVQLEEIEAQQRVFWMKLIRDIVTDFEQSTATNYNSLADNCDFAKVTLSDFLGGEVFTKVLSVATHLCDWPLTIYCRESEHDRLVRSPGNSLKNGDFVNNVVSLAAAYRQQGLLSSAQQLIESTMLLDYQNPFLEQCLHQLRKELFDFPYRMEDLSDGVVTLIPLAEQHFDSFFWAYADPDIAYRCNLPQFESMQHWLNWLHASEQECGKRVFAVIHRDWGFVGSVSLEVFAGIGFFYYWIDHDFQRQGLGPQAVSLLLEIGAIYFALDCCYAKVYDDNIASHKAMKKLGFYQISLTQMAPHDNETLYYLGREKNLSTLFLELEQLFGFQGVNTQLNIASGSIIETIN